MTLRTWQTEAIAAAESALARGERAVIQAIMGAGKSVVLAELAARAMRAGLHVVVTVPTQELVRQLARSISDWTGQVVGQWYADTHDLWPVTVVCQASIATYEAAWRAKYVVERWLPGDPIIREDRGWLEQQKDVPRRLWLADECHRTECDTMLAWDAPAKRIGVTATPWRAEMSRTISAFDIVCYEYGADRAYADGHVVTPTLHHDADVAEWVAMARQKWGGGVVNARTIADAAEFAREIEAVAVHSEGEADAEMARAVIRDGGVVVYVDMLAEGFDCPEIMWMALRRPVGSRVRFAQEVGRGLRACPSLQKDTCHMLDVHDLWGAHSMSWQAALGEMATVPVPALQLDLAAKQVAWTPESQDVMPPELLGPLRSWLRHERVQALFAGRIEEKAAGSRAWRSDPCSRKQLEYLDSLMRRVRPDALEPEMVQRVRLARAALVDCLERDPSELAGAFRKGDASDLIDVVRSL